MQLDFTLPDRFDLTHHGVDGEQHQVVMIHRGTVGSMERVVAAVLPVSEEQVAAARRLMEQLSDRGLRAELRCDDSLGARVRQAHCRRDTRIAVVGEREAVAGLVQVTDVAAGLREVMPAGRLVARAAEAHRQRLPLVPW